MKLILASTSIYRKRLLERAAYDFQAVAPLVDEEALKTEAPADVEGMTRFLALKKAESLLEKFPNDWIVGCDQAAAIGKKILNKPGGRDAAIAQLKRISGHWHSLITSMALVKTGEIPTVMTDVTRIRIRVLSRTEIEAYLDHDRPFDCAGSYKFESAGIGLIEDLRSRDPSAIEGLSLIALTSFFSRQGFSLAEILKLS